MMASRDCAEKTTCTDFGSIFPFPATEAALRKPDGISLHSNVLDPLVPDELDGLEVTLKMNANHQKVKAQPWLSATE